MSEGLTPQEIYSEHKEAAGALESTAENHDATKSELRDARKLYSMTENGDFDEGVVAKAKEIHESAKTANTAARNENKEAAGRYESNLETARRSVTPELVERAEYENEMRDKILNAIDEHNYGIAKDLLEDLFSKEPDMQKTATDSHEQAAPVQEAQSAESGPEIKECIDLINIETRNCFRPENLQPEEIKRLTDLLENATPEEVMSIVRSRISELKSKDYISFPTQMEKGEHKNRYGKKEQRDLTEEVLKARLSRRVLSEAEQQELEEALSKKGDSHEITDEDKRLLELTIKAYRILNRTQQEPRGVTRDLYTHEYGTIGGAHNDMSADELSKIILTSDYILKGVKQNRILNARKGIAVETA